MADTRFKYLPINEKEYFNKYINTLKTGELLVDLREYDLFVTEEGINIPIPSTKRLKDAVINYFNNDLAGISLVQKELPMKLERLWDLKERISEEHNRITTLNDDIEGKIPNLHEIRTHVNTISTANINQLGDIHMNLEAIRDLDDTERISELIFAFNGLNNDARSAAFDSESGRWNQELREIWAELNSLLTSANGKLDRLGSFSGSYQVSSTSTSTRDVYDIQYHQRLNNWSNYWGIANESQWISACRKLEANFAAWFKGQSYQDIRWDNMFDAGGRGTGLFYKGFPLKHNFTTNSKAATKYNEWDLFEGFPASDYRSKPAGYNIDYILSDTNRSYPDLPGKGDFATESDFTHKLVNTSRYVRAKFGGGNARWQNGWSANDNPYLTTTNALLDIISSVDSTGMQRIPRSTKSNARNGCFSNQIPTIPTVTRAVPYISTSNLRNNDGCIIRLGVRKKINVTTVHYNRVNL